MSENVEVVHLKDLTIVRLTGKLTKADYESFVPEVEKQIQEFGKLRLLVELHNFQGWTMGALWDDIKFDTKHWGDIKRLAIVGESKWEEGMAVFCKPFTSANVKYFDHTKLEEAKKWLDLSAMVEENPHDVRQFLDELYRSESRRVFATLVRLLGDFDLAEEAMHEAFTSAFEKWQQ
ncbi:unnamed protein product, partial [Symbiodinium microadriaticum]